MTENTEKKSWKQKLQNAWEDFKAWGTKTATAAMITLGLGTRPAISDAVANTPEQDKDTPKTETHARVTPDAAFPAKELIDRMASQDAARYTELQGKYMHDLLEKITARRTAYDQESDKFQKLSDAYKEQSGFSAAIAPLEEKYLNEELGLDEYKQMREQLLKQYKVDKYNASIDQRGENPQSYAARLCGLGETANYCLAIQTQAMRMAEKDMETEADALKPIRDNMGWTCQYATNTCQNMGIGRKRKITNLYTTDSNGRHLVNKDKDGNPLVKDGDIALIDYGNKKTYGHCVRLNVDANGILTYSAGNEDRDHAPITKLAKLQATVVSTYDYAHSLAKEKYQNLSREELLAAAEKRGLYSPARNNDTANFAQLGNSRPDKSDNDKPHHKLERSGSLFSRADDKDKGKDNPFAGFHGVDRKAADDGKKQLSAQLKRDAKHTLSGTIPASISEELKEFAANAVAYFNRLVDRRSEEKEQTAARAAASQNTDKQNNGSEKPHARLYARQGSWFSR